MIHMLGDDFGHRRVNTKKRTFETCGTVQVSLSVEKYATSHQSRDNRYRETFDFAFFCRFFHCVSPEMSVSSSLEILISSVEEDVRYDICESTHDKVMTSSSKRLREERRRVDPV